MLKVRYFGYLLFVMMLSHSDQMWADIAKPARDIHDVSGLAKTQSTVKVSTARIVAADYNLIKEDFSHTRNWTTDQIDAWILSEVGYISSQQAAQTAANTDIQTDGNQREAFRPPDYKRALVFAVENGLIDGKGFGAENPRPGDHSDGLATLGEVIREFLYQKLAQKVFDHSRSGVKTVGSYAVIDWGFRAKHADGSTSPAGAILRQAHKRNAGTVSLFDNETTKKIELLLRPYGLTTAGAYRDQYPYDKLNVQGTIDGAIVDFGGFLTVKEYTKPGHPFYGYFPILHPGTPEYVQPDEKIRVPYEIWGATKSGKDDPKFDNVWIYSHELANALAESRATRADVENHIRNMLSPVTEKLKTPRAYSCAAVLSGSPK